MYSWWQIPDRRIVKHKTKLASMDFRKKCIECVQRFNMTNHYIDPFLCLGFIFYVNVRQKNTSYRVNEMFLSCTIHSRLSVCWFTKLYADIIWCIKIFESLNNIVMCKSNHWLQNIIVKRTKHRLNQTIIQVMYFLIFTTTLYFRI